MSKAIELLKLIEELSILDEVIRRRYISYRGGKRSVRKTCGPGYRLVGNRCVRISPVERRRRSRASILAQRKLRGRRYRINQKRNRSIQRRRRAGY